MSYCQDPCRENDKSLDTFVEMIKFHDDGRKVTVELHLAEWSVLREQVLSLKNALKSKVMDLQSMLSSRTEDARLQLNLAMV